MEPLLLVLLELFILGESVRTVLADRRLALSDASDSISSNCCLGSSKVETVLIRGDG